ncbi:MAG: hypothetical protein ABIO70_06765 [Pseudomonadota bacterium]
MSAHTQARQGNAVTGERALDPLPLGLERVMKAVLGPRPLLDEEARHRVLAAAG